MKNILICGVGKSGKSYLANKINKGMYNHIPVDYFASAFKHVFPDVGITSNVVIDKNSSRLLAKYLNRVIEIIDSDYECYIIDSAHLYPEDIIKYIDIDKWDVVFLGYPNTTVDQKLIELRTYANNGWVLKKSDEELRTIISNLIIVSKEIQMQCNSLNIKFIDTSNFNNLDDYINGCN